MTSPTQYRSVEMAANCDLSAVYDLLAAECGLRFSVFLSPCILPPMRKQELRQRVADYTTLRDGIFLPGAQMRDPIAKEAADRLTCRLGHLNGPQFSLRWVISGRVAQSAALLSRLKQSVLTPDGSPITAWKQTSLPAVPSPAPLGLPGDFGGVFSLDEAAVMVALPQGERCGLELNSFSLLPQQPLPAQALTQHEDVWYLGRTSDHGAAVRYPLSALKYHGLIVGCSGFGKTSAAQNLMKVLLQNKGHAPVPLIIAPIKSEFRNLAKFDPETLIFSDFSSTSPLLLNIFLPPPGVPVGQYKRVLTQIFTAAFSLPDPLPSLFEHAIAASYRIFGWTDDSTGDSPGFQIFSLHEFIQVFSRQIRRSGYSGEVKGNVMTGGINRLRALLDRCVQFNTVHSVSMEDLLTRPCVIELGGFEGEDKALTVTLLLLSLFAYIKCKRPNGSSFRNLIFLDEAHTLLNVTSSGSGESGVMVRQLLERLLLEARGSGVALLLADQFPELLGSGIVSNTDFKLVYRLEGGQAEFMAEELGMSHEERRVLSRLCLGQALVSSHLQPGVLALNTPDRPAELAEGSDMTLDELNEHMKPYHKVNLKPWLECTHCPAQNCSRAVREKAAVLAAQMDWNRPEAVKTTDDLVKYLNLLIPSLQRKGHADPALCYCTAAQFLRQVTLDNHIFCCGNSATNLLAKLPLSGKEDT